MKYIYKVLRGGSWFNEQGNLRSAYRTASTADFRGSGGFRLARTQTLEEIK